MKKSSATSRPHSTPATPVARRTKPAPAVAAVAKRTVPAAAVRLKGSSTGAAAAETGSHKPGAKAAPAAVPMAAQGARRVAAKGGRTAPVAAPAVSASAPVATGKKGKKMAGKGRSASSAANEVFMHAIIPTRIERLEILRQLYDKRKETPTKPGAAGGDRPAEEEEAEGEFVVSDEIVSSDSSEA